MKQDAGKMMPGRIQPVELRIEHVGKRGERMPVASLRLSESGVNAGKRKARDNNRIFVNVILIVVRDELVPEGLAKDQPDQAR